MRQGVKEEAPVLERNPVKSFANEERDRKVFGGGGRG
jgi:hypothetical protein